MPKLILNPGTPQAREFQLRPGKNFIGRGFANDFKVEDSSVSTSHAQILVNGGAVIVKDLGSTNGTFVNRAPVTEQALSPGCVLRLGGVDLLFQDDGVTTAVAPGANPQAASAVAMATPVQLATASGSDAYSGPTVRITRASVQPAAVVAPPPVEKPVAVAGPVSHAPAPPAGEFATPPPGKTACKFHPKTAGQWLCRKCNELYCSVCVSTRPGAGGSVHFCRKCGDTCLPVKVNFVPKQEKGMVVHSDSTVLVRALGFGAGAAIIAALLWTGISWAMKFDVPFIFCAAFGALCGYAVKLGCQDRPGVLFSLIAVVWYLVGITLGKLGMILVTHNTILFVGGTHAVICLVGVLAGGFLAWWLGGGDF